MILGSRAIFPFLVIIFYLRFKQEMRAARSRTLLDLLDVLNLPNLLKRNGDWHERCKAPMQVDAERVLVDLLRDEAEEAVA